MSYGEAKASNKTDYIVFRAVLLPFKGLYSTKEQTIIFAGENVNKTHELSLISIHDDCVIVCFLLVKIVVFILKLK